MGIGESVHQTFFILTVPVWDTISYVLPRRKKSSKVSSARKKESFKKWEHSQAAASAASHQWNRLQYYFATVHYYEPSLYNLAARPV